MADEGRARKRPLDAQACVWVLMRSVTVPTVAEWGEAPHLQVALSGVYATQAAAEEACGKHQRALAAFCQKQSDESQENDVEGNEGGLSGFFSSQIKVVKMPVLQECPTTEPEYKFKEPKDLDIVLSDAPNEKIFSGPHADCDSYGMDCKPKTFCRVLKDANDEGGGE